MNKQNIQSITRYKKRFEELKEKFIEFGQRKSDFQIEKFIALSDSSIPSHIYRHVLVQLRIALTEIKRRLIEQERFKRKIERLKKEKPVDYDLDILQTQTEIDDLEYEILSRKDEIEKYDMILQELEKKYGKFTNEQYQKDEILYWTQRLARQMHDSIVDRMTGVNAGNLIALREAMMEPIINKDNKIIELPNNLQLLNQISKAKSIDEVNALIKKKKTIIDGDKSEVHQIQSKND